MDEDLARWRDEADLYRDLFGIAIERFNKQGDTEAYSEIITEHLAREQ